VKQNKTFIPEEIKLEVPKSQRKHLLELSHWKTPLLIFVLYAWAIFNVFVAHHYVWLTPVALVLIAGMQNHLLILVHEGAHGLIYPDRKINDWITEIFCALPCFTRVRDYRAFHFKHHRHTGDPERDPEIRFYADQGYQFKRTSGFVLFGSFVKDIFFVNMIRFAKSQARFITDEERTGSLKPVSTLSKTAPLIFWGCALCLSLTFGFLKSLLLFWIFPAATLMFLFLKLHGYGEHTGSSAISEVSKTFTRNYNFVTNYFLFPIGSGYHLEHHLYPQVPWYRLKAVRKLLIQSYPNLFKESWPTLSDGYFFGNTSIWKTMIAGEGEYRVEKSL